MALNVLVAFASRHGGTAAIAEEVASALDDRMGAAGVAAFVDVMPIEQVGSIGRYDAVVVGSAVYYGRWLTPARRLVNRDARLLAGRPVWLFSSGLVGDRADLAERPRDVTGLARLVEARGHRSFAGRLDRSTLGGAERLVVRLTRAPYRDDRDFPAVRSWATRIADTLIASLPASTVAERDPR